MIRTASGYEVDSEAWKEYVGYLRDALNHLHDPDSLRRNPLVNSLGIGGLTDAPLHLQRILTEAIEEMEPGPDEPSRSRAWRMYDTLFYRYVQQFSQREIAAQLDICARHVRREQQAALETLALRLWDQYTAAAALPISTDRTDSREGPDTSDQVMTDELAWLEDVRTGRGADLAPAVSAAVELAQPLAAPHEVVIEIDVTEPDVHVAVHPVALTQMLLELLGAAIQRAFGGQVRVEAQRSNAHAEIVVRCVPGHPNAEAQQGNAVPALKIAHHLATLCDGDLDVACQDESYCATLRLPILQRISVLAIDDNEDTLQLLNRYTTGTRFRLTACRNAERALELAQTEPPDIIVLDVMMPEVDGWRVLGRLHQHPLTRPVPTIVCTILSQEELAFALGASAYLKKPVTRQAFLAALDQQSVNLATGSR